MTNTLDTHQFIIALAVECESVAIISSADVHWIITGGCCRSSHWAVHVLFFWLFTAWFDVSFYERIKWWWWWWWSAIYTERYLHRSGATRLYHSCEVLTIYYKVKESFKKSSNVTLRQSESSSEDHLVLCPRPHRVGALSVDGSRLSVRLSVCLSILSREWNGIGRFVYDFCISKIDNESAHLAYSLLELTFVRSRSLSLSKDFADTDIQTMIDVLCTA